MRLPAARGGLRPPPGSCVGLGSLGWRGAAARPAARTLPAGSGCWLRRASARFQARSNSGHVGASARARSRGLALGSGSILAGRAARADRPFTLAARQMPVIDQLELTSAGRRTHVVGLERGGQRGGGRPATLWASVKRHTERFPADRAFKTRGPARSGSRRRRRDRTATLPAARTPRQG